MNIYQHLSNGQGVNVTFFPQEDSLWSQNYPEHVQLFIAGAQVSYPLVVRCSFGFYDSYEFYIFNVFSEIQTNSHTLNRFGRCRYSNEVSSRVARGMCVVCKITDHCVFDFVCCVASRQSLSPVRYRFLS